MKIFVGTRVHNRARSDKRATRFNSWNILSGHKRVVVREWRGGRKINYSIHFIYAAADNCVLRALVKFLFPLLSI